MVASSNGITPSNTAPHSTGANTITLQHALDTHHCAAVQHSLAIQCIHHSNGDHSIHCRARVAHHTYHHYSKSEQGRKGSAVATRPTALLSTCMNHATAIITPLILLAAAHPSCLITTAGTKLERSRC